MKYVDGQAMNQNQENIILRYLNIAHEEGLLVILRPGPYIDAEGYVISIINNNNNNNNNNQ
ncbi:hypothetical protein Avbf_12768 [Armadillidium vulgare]|nr:hypothetical protein Avbf_12768 [Armadillidium vulgare]